MHDFVIYSIRKNFYNIILALTQSAFSCLKLKIETLEQGVKYAQS